MSRRAAIAFAAWTATATAAIGAGLGAVSVIDAGIAEPTVKPMTLSQVRQALAKPASTTPAPLAPDFKGATAPQVDKTAGAGPRSVGVTRSLTSEGGDLLARCDQDSAYLVSWTPRQGYAATRTTRGPADSVSVQFESDNHTIIMVVTCPRGRPVTDVYKDGQAHGNQDGQGQADHGKQDRNK